MGTYTKKKRSRKRMKNTYQPERVRNKKSKIKFYCTCKNDEERENLIPDEALEEELILPESYCGWN